MYPQKFNRGDEGKGKIIVEWFLESRRWCLGPVVRVSVLLFALPSNNLSNLSSSYIAYYLKNNYDNSANRRTYYQRDFLKREDSHNQRFEIARILNLISHDGYLWTVINLMSRYSAAYWFICRFKVNRLVTVSLPLLPIASLRELFSCRIWTAAAIEAGWTACNSIALDSTSTSWK